MKQSNRGIIGLGFELFEEIVRTVMRQQMAVTWEEIKQTLMFKQQQFLQQERLTLEQVTRKIHSA